MILFPGTGMIYEANGKPGCLNIIRSVLSGGETLTRGPLDVIRGRETYPETMTRIFETSQSCLSIEPKRTFTVSTACPTTTYSLVFQNHVT